MATNRPNTSLALGCIPIIFVIMLTC